MPELEAILELADLAHRQADELCLVSVVGVEGSSYRKPGARMLLTRGGRRAGTISGGCLESEVSKKAWWLTEKGPAIQRYSSSFDEDSGVLIGLGCGGTVILLLERGPAVDAVLDALRLAVNQRESAVVVAELEESSPGTRLVMNAAGEVLYYPQDWSEPDRAALEQIARDTMAGAPRTHFLTRHGEPDTPLFCERIAPPPALWIFGAGDDVKPLVEFARELGWHVTVADGRSHLARPERFPHARQVVALSEENSASLMREIGPDEAVVLMTHSYEQDRALLAHLVARPLGYLGVLGPRSRTMHILEQLTNSKTGALPMTLKEAAARLHSPVGLDISAHTPAAIALSIAAEVQAVLSTRANGAVSQSGRGATLTGSHATV